MFHRYRHTRSVRGVILISSALHLLLVVGVSYSSLLRRRLTGRWHNAPLNTIVTMMSPITSSRIHPKRVWIGSRDRKHRNNYSGTVSQNGYGDGSASPTAV